MSLSDYEESGPRHKKKAKHKSPKKHNHRHTFEPCVLEYMSEDLDPHCGWVKNRKTKIINYCTVCGKIQGCDRDRWWTRTYLVEGSVQFWASKPSEEALRELNPETRTLPTFFSEEWLPSYVTPEGTEYENDHQKDS